MLVCEKKSRLLAVGVSYLPNTYRRRSFVVWTSSLSFPRLNTDWGVQRLKNLAASWRDQLLEVMGAMGLREVRRLRGEIGRCMFQRDIEREIFGEPGE